MNKNKFLTFIFSIIPGCGLMYLGYMKRGMQIMTIFTISTYLAYSAVELLRFEWLSVFFIALLPLIWMYQIFEAMHSVSRMKKWQIETPSDDSFFIPETIQPISFLKNEKIIKNIGLSLIFVGSCMFVFNISDNLYSIFSSYAIVKYLYIFFRQYFIPSVISVILIFYGFRLFKKK